MKIFFSVILFVFMTAGCNKTNDEPELPQATQVGANTFGCRIDGVPLSVEGMSSGFNYDKIMLNVTANTVVIIGGPVSMEVKFDSKVGDFPMLPPYQSHCVKLDNGTAITGRNDFTTDSARSGVLTVTRIDQAAISGTFSFSAVNDVGEVVRVTDGRFDIAR